MLAFSKTRTKTNCPVDSDDGDGDNKKNVKSHVIEESTGFAQLEFKNE